MKKINIEKMNRKSAKYAVALLKKAKKYYKKQHEIAFGVAYDINRYNFSIIEPIINEQYYTFVDCGMFIIYP